MKFFVIVLTLIFITLKLMGHIAWAWFWVLSPLWIWLLIVVMILLPLLLWVEHVKRKDPFYELRMKLNM